MQDRIDDTRLHRYFDGDLSEGEAEQVRRALDADPTLRAKLDGLREVRAVVRASLSEGLDAISADDLWSRIEGGLDAAPRSSASAPGTPVGAEGAPRLRAIPGGASGSSAAAPLPAVSAEHRRRRLVGVVVGALALAAAVLLLVVRPGEPGPGDAPIAEAPDTGEGDPAGTDGIDLDGIGAEVASTEVLEVDFGDNSGAIFSVEGDDGERYAVVWLADVQPKPAATE